MAKRSDAIKKITSILEFHLGNPLSGIPVEEWSREILDDLENEIGMIPPTTYLDKLKTYDNGWDKE